MKEITEDKGRIRPVVEGDFQCDENGNSTRFYEVLSIIGYIKDDGTKISYISKTDVPIGIPITDTEYWYPFQAIAVPKGDKGDKGEDGKSAYDLYIEHGGTITTVEAWLESLQGKDGKDAQPLLLRISADGQSLEISDDGGQTWYFFEKNFSKLRILGYVDDISKLPRVAEIGDIYGVLQEPVEQEEKAIYVLYINTVKNWLKDYTITRVYDYDTELPSSSIDGNTVLVPVNYLTLDKQKIDGYKIYRFNSDRNGWILILDTAEIYASKDDIINRGDNKYALVQGEEPNTYDLYRRDVGWVYFGTNNSITYLLVQNVEEGTDNNILSGKAVKDALDTKVDKEEGKSLIASDYANGIHYIENEEFVKAYIDGNDKFLWGIRRDSQIIYGAGVPVQIKDYIEEKIKDLSLDEYEDIVTFLDGLESDVSFKTLRELLNEKVDKVENKALINKDFADNVEYIGHPEFKEVKLDAENRILEATYNNGEKLLGAGAKVIGDLDLDSANITRVYDPEFIAAWTVDSKILFALDNTADFYFGAGVPRQIRKYVKDKISELLGDGDTTTIIDTLKEITSFLSGFVSGSNLLEYLNNTYGYYEDNPDYIKVELDSERKIIKAIKADGTEVFGAGYEVKGVKTTVIEDPNFIAVYLDESDKIIFAFKRNGDIFFGCGVPKQIQDYIISVVTPIINVIGSYEDSSEYLEVILDNTYKILAGRNTDGFAFEKVGFAAPVLSIDGSTVKTIDDVDKRTELKLDNENRIISYRDKQGILHENVGVKTDSLTTNHLNLTKSAMTEFQQELKDSGFMPGGAGDWTDAKSVHIAEPHCVKVNFTGIDDIPQQKYSDDDRPHAYMEFYDMNGNYFKKEVLINAQGRSTMGHPKKNIAIDICNNNSWNDDDTFKLQIGDWVSQDSFHLKAFYNDPFRCLCPVTYKLYDEVVRTRGTLDDYVWKRALINVNGITATSNAVTTAEDSINTGAKCVPAGFPCIVYLNGTFYGIYSWQLKKHRDNYHMKKTNKKHIHLDGVINQQSIFNANGNGDNIWWNPIAITIPGEGTKEGFEIRNPKSIVYAEAHDGSYKYDADAEGNLVPAGNADGSSTYDTWVAGSYPLNKIVTYNGSQFINTIAGNTAEPVVDAANDINTDKSPDFKNKTGCGWINCTISVNVKSAIIKLSTLKSTLDAADATYESSEKTTADVAAFKAVFETYLDTKNLIDYLIVSDISNNYDGWGLNWQWLTYNGKKWFIGMYDCDGVFGNWWQLTQQIEPPKNAHFTDFPINYIIKYYNTELESRYKDLRDLNILSTSHIVNLVTDWLDRVGNKETFDKEWAKWPSFIKNDSVMRLEKWIVESISNMDSIYNY